MQRPRFSIELRSNGIASRPPAAPLHLAAGVSLRPLLSGVLFSVRLSVEKGVPILICVCGSAIADAARALPSSAMAFLSREIEALVERTTEQIDHYDRYGSMSLVWNATSRRWSACRRALGQPLGLVPRSDYRPFLCATRRGFSRKRNGRISGLRSNGDEMTVSRVQRVAAEGCPSHRSTLPW